MELISRVLPNLSERGRVIVVGQPKQNSSLTFTSPSNFFLGEGQSIMSTQGGKINPSIDLYKYINLYKKGLLDINGIITHTVSLDEINFAINLLKEGKAGRIFIKM
jgi:Zn-dependent alcohol dehydrogenase